MKWEQYIAYTALVALIGFMIYGDYQFYFARKPLPPAPITNNYFAANSTQDNHNVVNNKRDQHWITGGSCGKNDCEVSLSYLW